MITCAAIRKGDKIYLGGRHHIIFRAYKNIDLRREEQGFVDQDGIFYTRVEAMHEALKCGQIMEAKRELYSEDVW